MRGIKGLLKFPSVPIILVHEGLSHQSDEWNMIPLWLFCMDPLSASWLRSLGHTVISFKRQVFYKMSTNEIELPEVSGNFPTSFLGSWQSFRLKGPLPPSPTWKVSWSWSKSAKRRVASEIWKMWILSFRKTFPTQELTLNWPSCIRMSLRSAAVIVNLKLYPIGPSRTTVFL